MYIVCLLLLLVTATDAFQLMLDHWKEEEEGEGVKSSEIGVFQC